MIADPRADALMTDFTGQWLQLRNLDKVTPDLLMFPDFDDNVRQAFRRETELFFASIVRENRSALDLLNADYTFVNERLARHYGIPRRLRLALPARASDRSEPPRPARPRQHPVDDRRWPTARRPCCAASTSSRTLNTPPLPPPPACRPRGERAQETGRRPSASSSSGIAPTPSCAACHRNIDPLGLRAGELRRGRAVARGATKGGASTPPACSPTARRSTARWRCGRRCSPARRVRRTVYREAA